MSTKTLSMLIAVLVLGLCASQAAGQVAPPLPTPPPGEIWVYPQGVFPNDLYSVWLAVNGTPYLADLPFPLYGVPDSEPGARPVFVGQPDPTRNWTVVLKARQLKRMGEGRYVEGPFTAFNFGLAAGTQMTDRAPLPPINYLLATDQGRFSTGFGEVVLYRPVEIRGELTPRGEEQFFRYTPNFDPAANPDTNPVFQAPWLPDTYPRGSEYDPELGYGVRSTKSVVYGGLLAFHVFFNRVDMSVSDCLLYGQYGTGIRINNPPSRSLISNVDIKHTYHYHMAGGRKNAVGMFTWAIDIEAIRGNGGKHLIEACVIDQSPTWQEYYFAAYPSHRRYYVEWFPGGHGVFVYNLTKVDPDDFIRIEDSTITNCGSNCIVHYVSNADLRIANCTVDGGYFTYTPTPHSPFDDWRGNCILVGLLSADQWNKSPVVEILHNRLIARGLDAWGACLSGCGNGEVTVADNTITCASASDAGYAGGVELSEGLVVGSNGNIVSRNTIQGTGGWAISVNAFDLPCERNSFIDNDLACFFAQEAGAVFFGPEANYNFFSGDPGAGIIDLGTGNVVE
jgi:hypothetical protein